MLPRAFIGLFSTCLATLAGCEVSQTSSDDTSDATTGASTPTTTGTSASSARTNASTDANASQSNTIVSSETDFTDVDDSSLARDGETGVESLASDASGIGLSDGAQTTIDAGLTTDDELTGEAGSESTYTDTSDDASTGRCTFQISGALSAQIPSVGVVDWSVDLPSLSEARIEFWLDDPQNGELNVGSGGKIAVDGSQALLLGLKQGRSYTYRLYVTDGAEECMSPIQNLVTGVDANVMPFTRVSGTATASRANGFTVVCASGAAQTKVFDADGDVVWWSGAPLGCSRALMDWDGKYMWAMKANAATAGAPNAGEVMRVRMDGTEVESIEGLEYSHHDFAVLPHGVTAFLVGDPAMSDSGSYLVERAADGALVSIVRLDNGVQGAASVNYHANAIRYYARDDSYTISDLNTATIVKLNRQGQRVWSTYVPCDDDVNQCMPVSPLGNHGHQLLENGNLLFFGMFGTDLTKHAAYEYSINRDGVTPTSILEWSYAPGLQSITFGDVQRLPNGNTLVTFSQSGIIHEVSPQEQLVQSFEDPDRFGYAHFRATLYGPPQ